MRAASITSLLPAIGILVLCIAFGGAPSIAGEETAASDALKKEWEPPVAQVPMMVAGHVLSVDCEQRTFTVMTEARRRTPPGEAVVGINSDTKMVRNQMLPMDRLVPGDEVRVHGSRPEPVGLPIYVGGVVTGVAPLTVAVSDKVTVIVQEGAEVQVVRLTELRLEDMRPGMEVQAITWRGDEPMVAREVQSFEVLGGVMQSPAADRQEASEQDES